MKKPLVLFSLFIVPLLASCNKGSIDMPNSPFDDHYVRIGMVGEYNKTDDMKQGDYNAIKAYINDPNNTKDVNVASYHQQQEDRDLKYAYFGEESSTISQCSMTSQNIDLQRYSNRISVTNNVNEQQIQTAKSGIQKSKSTLTDYTFDNEKKAQDAGNYTEIIETKNNDEEPKVTKADSGSYSSEDEIYTLFGLKPFNGHIRSHFAKDGEEGFHLLANDNKAVYFKSNDLYLIKEGYSLFPEYHTTMGRSYKAQENYFYEGLLEKVGSGADVTFRFTHFRFYHELLILSKAIDGTGVPVLYLDKPVLIEYSETTYSDIKYFDNESDLPTYTGDIPQPTNQ